MTEGFNQWLGEVISKLRDVGSTGERYVLRRSFQAVTALEPPAGQFLEPISRASLRGDSGGT